MARPHASLPPVGAVDGVTEDLRGSAWGPILLLAVILFGAGVMLTVFAPLQEAAKNELKLSDFAISLVQGLFTAAPVALIGVPLSWIIDHGHRVRLLIILLAACVIGTFWTAFVTGLTSLALARMIAAVGASCAVLVIISLVADLCAPDKRGRAIVVLGMGTFAGVAAAFAVGGSLMTVLAAHPIAWLGAMSAWRETHFVVGAFGALLMAPLFFLREPARHEVEIQTAALGPAFRAIWAKRRFLLPLFAGQLGITMADTAAGIWASPVLIRDFHQAPGAFAVWVGAMVFVGGLVGSIIGGVTADWGHKTGRRGGLLFSAVVATAIGIPAALFPVMHTLGGFQILFFLLLFSGAVTAVVSTTTVAVLIPNEERGASMAAFGVISNLVGKSLAPMVVTLGSLAMGGEQHLGGALAVTGVITGVISFGGYVLAMRNAPLSATEPGQHA
jgi:MFS family permease